MTTRKVSFNPIRKKYEPVFSEDEVTNEIIEQYFSYSLNRWVTIPK